MYLVFVLYALFASVFTIGKTALLYARPFFLIGSRMTLAGGLMLLYLYFMRPQEFRFQSKNLWKVCALAFFNIYLTNVCEFWGLQYLTSSKTCFIYSLSPFISALLCYYIFSERLTSKKWIGLVIGFVGFFPLLLTQGQEEILSGQFFLFSWAEVAVIIAAISSVYGWILLSQLVKQEGYSPFMANGLSMLIGGSLAFLHSSLFESWDPFPVDSFIPFFECTIALMIISNLLAYNLYGHLLKTYTVTFMSFAGFTTPFFAVLFGWLFLGEEVQTAFYLSATIVFIGLVLFHQEELKKEGVRITTA